MQILWAHIHHRQTPASLNGHLSDWRSAPHLTDNLAQPSKERLNDWPTSPHPSTFPTSKADTASYAQNWTCPVCDVVWQTALDRQLLTRSYLPPAYRTIVIADTDWECSTKTSPQTNRADSSVGEKPYSFNHFQKWLLQEVKCTRKLPTPFNLQKRILVLHISNTPLTMHGVFGLLRFSRYRASTLALTKSMTTYAGS